MRIFLAYISVVLIWATTPLAIKWSGQGPGFLFAVTGRMTLGMLCLLMLLVIFRLRLAWHPKARLTYLAVAVQIYGSMTAVYWAAQFIPSGWVSVLFGLTPLMTALFAVFLLNERTFSWGKLLSYFMGIVGLIVMFASAIQYRREAVLAITAILIAVLLQSFSAVWIKQINAKLPALTQVTGGLLLALPLYLFSWWIADGQWPVQLTSKTAAAIVYLGMIATPIGFVLYYYLLTNLSAARVALINLVTPVMSLLVGQRINQEILTSKVIVGTFFIIGALILHEFFDRLLFKQPN
jgi:drug/metabolite transporter (DMT)-like permease